MGYTTGEIISVKKQWWLKIRTKAIKAGPLDGAIFPCVVKVKYFVEEKEFVCKKWVKATKNPLCVGDVVAITYQKQNPKKFNIDFNQLL